MKKFLKHVVEGCTFEQVAAALGGGMHNISSHERRPGGELEQFLEANNLQGVPVVFMATHSIGEREVVFVTDDFRRDFYAGLRMTAEVPFYKEEGFNGGWYAVTAGDALCLRLVSATSGSLLEARRPSERSDRWTITMEVPIQEDGRPYQGSYWECFHSALGLAQEVAVT